VRRTMRDCGRRCAQSRLAFSWEVTNQAGVHLWFEREFGHPVHPLRSLVDAVASCQNSRPRSA